MSFPVVSIADFVRIQNALIDGLDLIGLRLYVPPKVMAGWYYPDHTLTFCIARPRNVYWLPEQEEGEAA